MTPSSRALGKSWPSRPCRDSAPPRRDKTPQWSSAYLDRRIGRASTPGYRWELVGFSAWRPLLANYRKPAPVFVKQRLKLTAGGQPSGMPGRSHCQELASSADSLQELASACLRRERGDCLGRLQFSPASTTGLAPARNPYSPDTTHAPGRLRPPPTRRSLPGMPGFNWHSVSRPRRVRRATHGRAKQTTRVREDGSSSLFLQALVTIDTPYRVARARCKPRRNFAGTS